jgi:hypothetical protein|nr:MAG TPA: hypothetical protein [Inoviridae sp.]
MNENFDAQNLDEKKVNNIKIQILDMEAENVVKKESNPAMVEKIKKMIIREVEKR